MSAPAEAAPSSRFLTSQRLRLHYVDWGNEAAPPLVLVHGGRDHARSWDWVARELRRDWHVVAPDLRGHGDSAWAIGGSYAMAEFVLDIAAAARRARAGARSTLVGHSLGGAVALHYAAIYPERVRKLVAIEGLGAAAVDAREHAARAAPRSASRRLDRREMREIAARQPRRYPSLEAAAARMREAEPVPLRGPGAPPDARTASRRNEDGTYAWKFDNYVRAPRAARPRLRGPRARSGRASPARRCSCAARRAGPAIRCSTGAPPPSATRAS